MSDGISILLPHFFLFTWNIKENCVWISASSCTISMLEVIFENMVQLARWWYDEECDRVGISENG